MTELYDHPERDGLAFNLRLESLSDKNRGLADKSEQYNFTFKCTAQSCVCQFLKVPTATPAGLALTSFFCFLSGWVVLGVLSSQLFGSWSLVQGNNHGTSHHRWKNPTSKNPKEKGLGNLAIPGHQAIYDCPL